MPDSKVGHGKIILSCDNRKLTEKRKRICGKKKRKRKVEATLKLQQ